MRVLLCGMVLSFFVFCVGCTTTNMPNNSSGDIACILTVEKATDNIDGDYVVNATIYSENNGKILASPRLLTKNSENGILSIQEADGFPFKLDTDSFGEISCNVANGLYFISAVQKASDTNVVNVKLCAIWQEGDKQQTSLFVLDVPRLSIVLGEKNLLVKRNGITIQTPVGTQSAKSENGLHKISRYLPETK